MASTAAPSPLFLSPAISPAASPPPTAAPDMFDYDRPYPSPNPSPPPTGHLTAAGPVVYVTHHPSQSAFSLSSHSTSSLSESKSVLKRMLSKGKARLSHSMSVSGGRRPRRSRVVSEGAGARAEAVTSAGAASVIEMHPSPNTHPLLTKPFARDELRGKRVLRVSSSHGDLMSMAERHRYTRSRSWRTDENGIEEADEETEEWEQRAAGGSKRDSYTRNLRTREKTAVEAAMDGRYVSEWGFFIKCYAEGRFNVSNPPDPPPRRPEFLHLAAPVPSDERERMKAVRACDIPLTRAAQEKCLRLVMLARKVFQTRMAAISIIDEREEVIKVADSFEKDFIDREASISAHVLLGDEPMVVLDTAKDWRLCGNPLVTGPPKIRFYAGAPIITHDGATIGVFAVFDSQPRTSFPAASRRKLTDFARMVMTEIELVCEEREMLTHSNYLSNRLRALDTPTPTSDDASMTSRRSRVTARLMQSLEEDASRADSLSPSRSPELSAESPTPSSVWAQSPLPSATSSTEFGPELLLPQREEWRCPTRDGPRTTPPDIGQLIAQAKLHATSDTPADTPIDSPRNTSFPPTPPSPDSSKPTDSPKSPKSPKPQSPKPAIPAVSISVATPPSTPNRLSTTSSLLPSNRFSTASTLPHVPSPPRNSIVSIAASSIVFDDSPGDNILGALSDTPLSDSAPHIPRYRQHRPAPISTTPTPPTRPPSTLAEAHFATSLIARSLGYDLVYLLRITVTRVPPSPLVPLSPYREQVDIATKVLVAHGLPSPPPRFDAELHWRALRSVRGLIYQNPVHGGAEDRVGYQMGVLMPLVRDAEVGAGDGDGAHQGEFDGGERGRGRERAEGEKGAARSRRGEEREVGAGGIVLAAFAKVPEGPTERFGGKEVDFLREFGEAMRDVLVKADKEMGL